MKDISGKNTIGYFTVRVRFQEDYQGILYFLILCPFRYIHTFFEE